MADYIYWIEFPATIRRAPLAGAGTPDTIYASPPGTWNVASGLAIDPAAGHIYWTNYGDDGSLIRRAPLSGGGTVEPLYDSGHGVSEPFGVAVDPVAGRIYWSNGGDDTIRRAPLAGGPSADPLYDSGHGVSAPTGIAIDPAAGQIYWCDRGIATIRGAPLAGVAGGGRLISLYGPADVAGPVGVAIDATAGRIYWTNWWWPSQGAIRGARIAGGGPVDTLYDSTRVSVPVGLAIDPNPAGPERLARGDGEGFEVGRWLGENVPWLGGLFSSGPPGRIYWSNASGAQGGVGGTPNDNKIEGAPLAGHGSVDALYGTLFPPGPGALALLRAPLGAGAPMVSLPLIVGDGPFGGMQFGGSRSGPLHRPLFCSRGTWAPDLLGSHLYRAPQSFAYQWRLNGTDIPGARADQFTPSTPGSYSCQVTATNEAGSVTQTSAAVAIS